MTSDQNKPVNSRNNPELQQIKSDLLKRGLNLARTLEVPPVSTSTSPNIETGPNFDRTDTQAWIKLGHKYSQKGRVKEAIECFSEAIRLDSTNSDAYSYRADIYFNSFDYQSSLDDYTMAIKLDPEQITAHFNRGVANLELGNYKAAYNDFTQMINYDSTNWEYYLYRGLSGKNLNNFESALEDYATAISLDEEAHCEICTCGYRAEIYLRIGNIEEAWNDCEEARKLNSQYFKIDLIRAIIIYFVESLSLNDVDNHNFFENIIDNLDTYLDEKSHDLMSYFFRGCAYFYISNYEKAFQEFNLFIDSIDDDNMYILPLSVAYGLRGVANLDREDKEAALDDFNKSLELHKKPDIFVYRGNIYRELNDVETAINDYTCAILLQHDYSDAYFERGNLYFDLSRFEDALNDYSQAILIKPNDPNLYFNRGATYQNLGDLDYALLDYDKTIDLNPEFEQAYINRSKVRKLIKDI